MGFFLQMALELRFAHDHESSKQFQDFQTFQRPWGIKNTGSTHL